MASLNKELKVRFQEPRIIVQRKEEEARKQARLHRSNPRIKELRTTGKRLTDAARSSLGGVHQVFKELKAEIAVESRALIHRDQTTTFKSFGRLPFEIREKIWEFAIPNRLITFAHPTSNWALTTDIACLQNPRNVPFGHNGIKPAYEAFALLRACYESRLVALRHLHRTNSVRHPLQPQDPTPRPAQFRRAAPGSELRRPNHHDPFHLDADAALVPLHDTVRGRSFRDPTVRHLLTLRHLVVEIDQAPRGPHLEAWTGGVNPFSPSRAVAAGNGVEDKYMLGHFADLETVTFVFRPPGCRRRHLPARLVGPRAHVVHCADETAGREAQLRELYGDEGPKIAAGADTNCALSSVLDGVGVHPTARVRIGRVVDPDEWKQEVKQFAWRLVEVVGLVVARIPAFVLLSPFFSRSVAWEMCFDSCLV